MVTALTLLSPALAANFAQTGVKEYKTDLKTQKVNVTTEPTLDLEKVTAVIKKTGKEVVSSKTLDAPPAKVEEVVSAKELDAPPAKVEA